MGGWLRELGQMRQRGLVSPSISYKSAQTGSDTSHSSYASHASNSVDGMVSRSSTASRDSIAPVVKETFGDGVDKFRHVEGRLETFTSAWPHAGHVRLNAERMAKCGFLFAPDALAPDKVLCAYCGLELAHWEDHDDPHTAHNDNSPGCSFWRKSSTSGQRLSRDLLFSGYGSPYPSLFRSAAADETRLSGHRDSD